MALFGPAVTRRVGAAAARAVEEGRWAALHLAVAASDVLGPEQLERVLALEASPGVQDAAIVPGGLPSVLGRQLRQVLGPVPRPRRLDLILDLWGRVLDHHAALARRERRLATQSNRDRAPDLRKRRRAAPRLVEDAGPALGTLARRAWDDTAPEVLDVYAAVAATPPDAALVRLRRMGAAQLASAVRRALDAGRVDLTGLWEATANRPLAAALDALDPALRDRFDRLALLLEEPPLPKTLRRLIKLPDMADAYNLDLAGRRTRRAIGRLAAQDDPVIAHALARRATEPLLCALTVAVTCDAPDTALAPVTAPRKIRVPGYPATTLKDENGPWPHALAAARELGADTAGFWDEIAAHGCASPRPGSPPGGWTALWSRAHSHRR